MSATLHWTPPPSNGGTLSDELKRILGKKLCGTDGTTGHPITVNESIVSYLEGLADSNVKDADKLIKLINKHGELTLTWQH